MAASSAHCCGLFPAFAEGQALRPRPDALGGDFCLRPVDPPGVWDQPGAEIRRWLTRSIITRIYDRSLAGLTCTVFYRTSVF